MQPIDVIRNDDFSQLDSTSTSDYLHPALGPEAADVAADHTKAAIKPTTTALEPIPKDRSLVPVHPTLAARLRYQRLMRAVSQISLAALLAEADREHVSEHESSTPMDDVRADSCRLAQSASLIRSESTATDGDEAEISEASSDAIAIVRLFMARKNIEILFDGTMRCTTAPLRSYRLEDLARFLSNEDVSSVWLMDEIMLELRARGSKLTPSDIGRAFRSIERHDRRERKKAIALRLAQPLTDIAKIAADQDWERLATSCFETDKSLVIASMQHFIWQVKRKMAGIHVVRHLMPIVYSPVQGSGKTTFIEKFLAPLQELASAPILISDFTDKRNADLYRFPVLVADDMENVEYSHISILKGLMTTKNGIRRRSLGTSLSENIRQGTTLIGTANKTVAELVADKTGNRRFVGLLFRNGEIAKGGDRAVWDTVDTIDFDGLWRSVDPYGSSPIESCLEDLAALQEAGRVIDELETWLSYLDLTSEAFKDVAETRHGAPAKALFEFYKTQTGSAMTQSAFGNAMTRHVANPAVPFGPKKKIGKVWIYAIKLRTKSK